MSDSKKMLEQALSEHQRGNFDQASIHYSAILRNTPRNARALFLFGTLQCQQKKFTQAIELLESALSIEPKMYEAMLSLGNVYLIQDDLIQAEKYFLSATEAPKPSADTYNSLGILKTKKNQHTDAIHYFERALDLNPKHPSAKNNEAQCYIEMGNRYKNSGDFLKAEMSYKKACELNPKSIIALNNLAIALKDQDKLDESLKCYEKILSLGPVPIEIMFNLALTLKELGRYQEALAIYDKTLQHNPENAEAHYNRAKILLTLEDFERGWPEFEWRLKLKSYQSASYYVQKKWDGAPLTGKSILIFGEQGIGDEIVHATVVPEIIAASGECYFECHPKLVSLFSRSFPTAKILPRNISGEPSAISQNKKIDYQCAIGSTMQFLRNKKENFSSKIPFIIPDNEKINFWKTRLDQFGSLPKIGLSWKSSAQDKHNASRAKGYPPLDFWDPLLTRKEYNFVNLQYGETEKDKKFIFENFQTQILDWDDLDKTDDLDSVAALVTNLDLVISINSAVAYLAAGLGKEVWIISPYNFGKVVGKDYQGIWFPNANFFLQKRHGDWSGLLSQITENLTGKFS